VELRLFGTDNESHIKQNGNKNVVRVTQMGVHNTNDSTVIQGRLDSASVIQGGVFAINTSLLSQEGKNNQATIDQNGYKITNDSTLIQGGHDNIANVTQNGSHLTNTSTVTQSGNHNNATVTQH
jgi:DNA-binding winged helix-turn-helix (wHTH) protein